MPIVVEVCSESVESAVAAQQGGASRIELCRELFVEGLTPLSTTIQEARKRLHIPLHVLIRPRGGDFVYSDDEIALMEGQILDAKQKGADGVVIGALNKDGTIDRKRTAELVQLARPMSVTFHRAFDVCKQPLNALGQLIRLGVDWVLTSGGGATAVDGVGMLNTLNSASDSRIKIIAAGAISRENVGSVIAGSRVTEIHLARGVSTLKQSSVPGEERKKHFYVDRALVTELVQQVRDLRL